MPLSQEERERITKIFDDLYLKLGSEFLLRYPLPAWYADYKRAEIESLEYSNQYKVPEFSERVEFFEKNQVIINKLKNGDKLTEEEQKLANENSREYIKKINKLDDATTDRICSKLIEKKEETLSTKGSEEIHA